MSSLSITLDVSARRKIAWLMWRLPIMVMVSVSLILGYALYTIDERRLQAMSAQQTLMGTLNQARERLNRVSQEEREIIDKSNQFLMWEKSGVVGTRNDLDIKDFLYSSARDSGITEFEFESAQGGERRDTPNTLLGQTNPKPTSTPTPHAGSIDEEQAPDQLWVSLLTQTLRARVQHEQQLFDFLSALSPSINHGMKGDSAHPPALPRIHQCSIEPLSPTGPLSPTANNFQAQCQIDWINFIKQRSS